ncbi:unnamed protein product [Caretta caretta]
MLCTFCAVSFLLALPQIGHNSSFSLSFLQSSVPRTVEKKQFLQSPELYVSNCTILCYESKQCRDEEIDNYTGKTNKRPIFKILLRQNPC